MRRHYSFKFYEIVIKSTIFFFFKNNFKEYEKCPLKPYIKYFENFVEGITKEIREKNRGKSI